MVTSLTMSTAQGAPQPLATSDLNSLRKIIQTTFQSSRVVVQYMEDLPNQLHQVRLLHLSNGSRLILKAKPPASVALLKHERQALETEALALSLLDQSGLPIPSVVKHERSSKPLGSPFLITTSLRGILLAEALPVMNRSDRLAIERQISTLETAIAQHVSPTFGPMSLVSSGQGHVSWREAYKAMLEGVLKDGEDVFLNLPYSQIRQQVARAEGALDEVQEARLIVLGLGDVENILIDERTNEITGVIDFNNALWGDAEMGTDRGATGTRGLLYACYEAVVTIVTSYYRPQREGSELGARRNLTMLLSQLATVKLSN
ncbi:MAG: hypothetical protein Q9187_000285 [Circinaria calcarea]